MTSIFSSGAEQHLHRTPQNEDEVGFWSFDSRLNADDTKSFKTWTIT
jgi:hypothetical protein